ncbi:MAG: NADH-quinone oxidoreductase subunit J [Cyclobacteriaceae bacterium]|nr:NADH-quinone oxidoreductase subunit J [Cyclobacteriaceae bacterium]MCH8515826.1 NADH-quinone oxidoreductase subunit J [Cyclobacteriaceae bacterium]
MELNIYILIFFAFGSIALLGGVYILFTSNVLRAAFSLLATMLAIAVLYLLLNADFLAISQLLIYAGGILVIMIFGVMFTNRFAERAMYTETHNRLPALLLTVGLGAIFYVSLFQLNFSSLSWQNQELNVQGSIIENVGVLMLSNYILPFELIAVLLLIALVGAVYVARKDHEVK